MEILRVEHLSKIYGKGENEVRALDGVSFTVNKGEFVADVARQKDKVECLKILLTAPGVDVNRPSSGMDFGTPLFNATRCANVEAASRVSVLFMDWITTGASPPMGMPPTFICLVIVFTL